MFNGCCAVPLRTARVELVERQQTPGSVVLASLTAQKELQLTVTSEKK